MKWALFVVAIGALLGCTPPPAGSAGSPAVAPSAEPLATGVGASAPAGTYSFTARPAATCRVLPTPDYIGQEPPHAPVNGQPGLSGPTLRGVILVQIRQCRDIQAILKKYGLPGPATRYIDVPETDDTIANGSARWFRIGVALGTESATVVELYRHPEDIEYVQLIPEFTGGPASS